MDDNESLAEDTGPIQEARPEGAAPDKELSPAARRALEEAAARRQVKEAGASGDDKPTEYYGPSGQEPTRFGDWERKGVAYDF